MPRPKSLPRNHRVGLHNDEYVIEQCFVDLTGPSYQLCPRCDHQVTKSSHPRFRSYSHLGDSETMRIFRVRYNNYYCGICRPTAKQGKGSYRKFYEDLSWISPGATSCTWSVYKIINDYFKEQENRYSISRYMWKFFKVNVAPHGINHMRNSRLKYKKLYKIPPAHMWIRWNEDEIQIWNELEHGSPYTSEKIRDRKFWVNFDEE